MEPDRAIVLILYILGAALPIIGAVRAVLNARDTLKKHADDVDDAAAIQAEWSAATSAAIATKPDDIAAVTQAINGDFHQRFTDRGLLVPSYETASRNATGDLAVSRVLHLLAKGQGGNAALVALGIFASTVAAVWSLWLPAAA
jgi:hypothetical protein